MIAWTDHYPGGSLRGYYESPWSFEETVARLITASGQSGKSRDGDKTSIQFDGIFNGLPFDLYDYKEDRAIHVGSSREFPVHELTVELTAMLAAVEPTPYSAQEFYDEKKGHSWDPRSVHMSHCYRGEYPDSCKYGQDDCPAAGNPRLRHKATKLVQQLAMNALVRINNGKPLHLKIEDMTPAEEDVALIMKALDNHE